MKFFFRVDASSQIGSGHVIRCLTLAKALKQQGANCKFIWRDQQNNLIEIIIKKNFVVTTISHLGKTRMPQRTKDAKLNYSNWMRASWNEENYKLASNISEYLNANFMEVNHTKYLFRVSHIISPKVGSCNNPVFKL